MTEGIPWARRSCMGIPVSLGNGRRAFMQYDWLLPSDFSKPLDRSE
eukprot:SAG11_NODE_30000_length_305_cov_0.747573_1_plen_45_part_10